MSAHAVPMVPMLIFDHLCLRLHAQAHYNTTVTFLWQKDKRCNSNYIGLLRVEMMCKTWKTYSLSFLHHYLKRYLVS